MGLPSQTAGASIAGRFEAPFPPPLRSALNHPKATCYHLEFAFAQREPRSAVHLRTPHVILSPAPFPPQRCKPPIPSTTEKQFSSRSQQSEVRCRIQGPVAAR